MPHIAFATCASLPDIDPDDDLTAKLLRAGGVEVDGVVWDDPDADWSRYDAVVIRSTWDYHQKPEQFVRWVQSFQGSGRLWNPPEVVLANLNKRYLVDFAARGVSVVPTKFYAAGTAPPLPTILQEQGWYEAIIKPAVSAGARDTWRTSRATAEVESPRFAIQARTWDILVQPFMPEVANVGEWSLFFFDGVYSHAGLKTPGPGDFRVQQHLGGSTQVHEPSAAIIQQAQAVLAQVPQTLPYARLDGIERDGRFILMELEVTEPFLFLEYHPDAPQRFANALKGRVRSS